MKRLLLAAPLATFLVGGYYFRGFFFEATPETRVARPPAGQSVVADVVVEMEAPIEVTAIGTVQPIATVMVKSRIDGEITQVHFDEGQEVKEGDLSVLLDNRAFRAQLHRAKPISNVIGPSSSGFTWRCQADRIGQPWRRVAAKAGRHHDREAVFEATVRAARRR